ncbi:FAD-dependent oxidoreductase [Pseudonocardiaceae bacterium YIM PH 21723]|nr:FAD-dependent oxidoreductase [Pseudonocardiaceae bacterium YIM PH 21723]
MSKRVLISGASIAGPALAHCLAGYGFEVAVVERAPHLRPGGQAVDIRGVGKDVIRRIGLDAQIRAAMTDTKGMGVVDRDGIEIDRIMADEHGGDGAVAEIEILRGELAKVFYEATQDRVEYRFGDHITSLTETSAGMDVGFASGHREVFDMVIGADGLNSGVRSLAFEAPDCIRDLGLLVALATVPNKLGLDNWWLVHTDGVRTTGIRSVRGNAEAITHLGFPGDRSDFDRGDVAGQKALVRKRMGDMGWETPWLLDQLDTAKDFYFDSISQVYLPSWSTGRVALLGDAAYCPAATSGQGTNLAIIGAYVLAGELAKADGDHTIAFPAYERVLRDFVEGNQKMGADNARSFLEDSEHRMEHMDFDEMNTIMNNIDLPHYA